MSTRRFDAVVVGAGPAGSVAAFALASGGANVALLDRVRFPRDKACGDLLSPRTIVVLAELGIVLHEGVKTGDGRLIGPTGRTVPLPWPRNAAFPDQAVTIPRLALDEYLRQRAISAGAEFVQADAESVGLTDEGAVVRTSRGHDVAGRFLIGADGSLSRVAHETGLATADKSLWGFALRYYASGTVDRPLIAYWEPTRGVAFPGYGWVFPGEDGRINIGLGMSVGSSRGSANLVAKSFPAFVEWLESQAIVDGVVLSPEERLGGWLKMGLAGTQPSRDQVMLVGDAAGLINPLAGEGISGAVLSARDAANAILDDPGHAATRYRERLGARHGSFYPSAAALQSFMTSHPRLLGLTGRLLTTPGLGRALSGPWSMYWNDLVDGAAPGRTRTTARAIGAFSRAMTVTSPVRQAAAREISRI